MTTSEHPIVTDEIIREAIRDNPTLGVDALAEVLIDRYIPDRAKDPDLGKIHARVFLLLSIERR